MTLTLPTTLSFFGNSFATVATSMMESVVGAIATAALVVGPDTVVEKR